MVMILEEANDQRVISIDRGNFQIVAHNHVGTGTSLFPWERLFDRLIHSLDIDHRSDFEPVAPRRVTWQWASETVCSAWFTQRSRKYTLAQDDKQLDYGNGG